MTQPSERNQSHARVQSENSTNHNFSDILVESRNLCRICLASQKEGDQQLIEPCKCAGTLKYVHISCYYIWIRHLYDRLQSSEDKQKMECEGFQCQICKTNIKVQFEFKRSLVDKEELGKICRNSIPLTITIIIFFMIATGAFAYLVYFADMTKDQFQKENMSQAFFTVIGIIVVILFFGAGAFFFITKYLWIQKMFITNLKAQEKTRVI